ncbi:MAG TPA: amino acid adenylation domain-containing protein [Bacteroidales bacterium]|nr:amino acid adenylation domain-containing protein [Bacteroidales bacterium]HSA42469.1 amino acid adenylation domain-containing protein [Bacteroidales bacterium]
MNLTNIPGYPLSHAQKRIWYTEMIHLNTAFANLPFKVICEGSIDFSLLTTAIRHVIKTNEGLRIQLREKEVNGMTEIEQYVCIDVPEQFPEFDFSGPGGAARLSEWLGRQSRLPFTLTGNPLFYFALLRYSDTEWGYFLNIHHLIADGWTVNLITKAIQDNYQKLLRQEPLTEERYPSFIDSLQDEENYLQSDACAKDREFWFSDLLPMPEEIVLPFSKNRSDNIRAKTCSLTFSSSVRQKMHAYCESTHSSVFKLVLSALAVYVNRITGLDDVVISTVNHGRDKPEHKLMTGMFVSTFPVRISLGKDLPFESLVSSAGEKLNKLVRNHSRYPADRLISELREKTGSDPSWIMNLMLVGHPNLSSDSLKLEYIFPAYEPSPLAIHINPSGKDALGELELLFNYQVDLFDEADIVSIFKTIETILDDGLSRPEQILSHLRLVSEHEYDLIMNQFNNTAVDFPKPLFLKDLFEAQVERSPDKPAVVYQDIVLTYRELNNKANQLAAKLRQLGGKPDAVVGILAERSHAMIVALMATVKAGCAYVPIDAAYPAERIQYMLENSQAFVLLSNPQLVEKTGYTGPFVDIEDEAVYRGDEGNPVTINSPHDLLYIIYTSGSTGTPKGVMIEQWSVTHFVLWHISLNGLNEHDRVSKFASFGFDVSVIEMYPTLITGATLHIIGDDIRLSLFQLNEYFEKNGITVAFLPTQFGEQFIENVDNKSLRWLDVAGEKLRSFKKQPYTILNGYGPTEYTVYTTAFVVDRFYNNIPIGVPLWNTKIYILDKYDQLRPVGIPGELCVAGCGIARGYLGRPDLTDQKFVPDPFRPGEKMYRTGDLCRWLPDGNIEYLGRMDFQVKIRGFRVELGEIEQAIKGMEHITDAVVVDRQDASGRTYLAGFFVASATVDPSKIKERLETDLPEYMIPPYLSQIETMPLTPNGKINRKALPETGHLQAGSRDFIPPSTVTEKKLASLWEQILGVDSVGAGDDFFKLGGHSLKAVLLQARIRKEYGINLSLQNIFHHAVLSDLAALMDSSTREDYPKITHLPDREYYPASAAQKRLFIVNQMENIGITYNIPIVTLLEGEADQARLSAALDTMAERHEILRTSFEVRDGEIVQVVHPGARIKRIYQEAENSDPAKLIRDFIRPFDLETAPLFRAGLIRISRESCLFILDFHHIIFDGGSTEVFMDELWELYKGKKLPRKKLQYRDYAGWQQKMAASGLYGKQQAYWIRQFEGEIPVLNMETDFPRASTLSFEGARFRVEADATLASGLKDLAMEEGVTLFMVLLSAYAILLTKYTGQEDLVIGIPSSGRTVPELQRMIGMFVNSLPVRIRPEGEMSIHSLLGEVKTLVLEASDKQDYQLDSLIEKLGITRDPSRNPLFDVMFAYRQQAADIRMKSLTVKHFDFIFNITKFDLTIEAVELPDTIGLEIEYRKSLFHENTIRNLASHYLAVLNEMVRNRNQKIREMDILQPAEKHFLFHIYNDTTTPYPEHLTVYELFEQQADRTPDKAAVIQDERSVSFRELDIASSNFAGMLRQEGIRPGQVIGVMMEQSIEFITVIMGVIRAGAAYLPIDPEYPEDRIQYILENSASPLLVCTAEAKQKAGSFQGNVLLVDKGHPFEGNGERPGKMNRPEDLVYIIYTSGSTGKPKGVMITHKGLVNYICWAEKVYLEGEAMDFPLYSSISFDLTVTSIFTPLVSGNSIVVYAGGDKSTLIKRLVEDKRTDIVKLTPTHLAMIENLDCSGSRLRKFIVGGEELRTVAARKIMSKFPYDVKIFNEYGPTETVVGCMIHSFDPARDTRPAVPIGVPADNAHIYLLDKYLMPVPPGVAGEMYIAGDGVARGYINRPDITAERFLPDPFFPETRMYKTGDLAKFLADGTIEFLGRVDFQVKIRGFRIELGEIESKLSKHPDLKDAVVLPQQDENGQHYLCAYVVSGRQIPVGELKSFLSEDLPDYMIPSYFIPLEVIPLTPNGKVDRNKLPKTGDTVFTGVAYIEPRNETETLIRDIFTKILKVSHIGINDNFFDLGGNSLRAVALVAELQKHFEITVNDVFQYQTVAMLAKNARKSGNLILTRLQEIRDHLDDMPDPEILAKEDISFVKEMTGYRASIDPYKSVDYEQKRVYRTILLTGATGFLGAYLLREVLSIPGTEVLLPVRAGSDQEAWDRLQAKTAWYFGQDFLSLNSDRIRVIPADLAEAQLGMKADTYRELLEKTDCILHPAALVKHYGHYSDFYNNNVRSVENLIAFALSGKQKDFHHISTISVGMGQLENRNYHIFTEDKLDEGQKSELYYLTTKLQAEKILHEARKNGLMANIYRVGNITFDAETGTSQENINDNAFFHIFRAFLTLGFIPDKMDSVEFSFVDKLGEAIIRLMHCASLRNETFHLRNTELLRQSEFLTKEELGLRALKVRFRQFIDRLVENYQVPEFRPHIEALILHFGWMEDLPAGSLPCLYLPMGERTDYVLSRLGFAWPRLQTAMLGKFISQALAERTQTLKTMNLFAGLSGEELERIARLAVQRNVEEDSGIVWEGERDDYFYVFSRGSVELSRHSRAGWAGTVMVAGRGDFIGADRLFNDRESNETAEAILGDVHLFAFRLADMKDLVSASPTLGANLVKILAERVSRLSDLFVNLA